MPISVLRQTNPAGLADALQPRGDIDAVSHQIAVALLDHVAQMDTDAELDALVGRDAGIALDHAILHLDGAARRVDHAAELDDDPVAGALDDAAVVESDGRIHEIAAQRAQQRQRTLLIGAGEPAIADDIGDQDRGEFARLAHRAPLGVATLAQMRAPVCLFDGRTAHVGIPSDRAPTGNDGNGST